MVDPNNKERDMDDMTMKRNWGTLKPRVPCCCFFSWSSWKFQLNSFDVNDFWASAIIVFDQEINDDTPYLFFTISGDLLVRVILYLSFYVHFDQGNAIVYPAMKWCQTDLWPNLPDRKCCHASYLQLEIRKNTVEVRTKRIEIYVYLQCISTIIW